eukprot:7525837-Lingulodinium_polyedra.AAC.1
MSVSRMPPRSPLVSLSTVARVSTTQRPAPYWRSSGRRCKIVVRLFSGVATRAPSPATSRRRWRTRR